MKVEDVKKVFQARTDRVKGVDFHPTEPWILTTLYSGRIQIWSYETGAVVKTIDVTDVPVRAGRFVARKNWVVVGSDDFEIRVYNYNTGEKVAQFEAHPDYIRAICVHPSQPYVLTASDDMTIKLWNWEKNWHCDRIYEGHAHYVMSIAINPKDPNTFASACLDRSIKIWSLGSSVANFTLESAETKGFNFVEYYPHSDKPYLITASDSRNIKVWDYQTKACVATMEGHTNNVSFAIFHPELPLIVSGAEDSTVKLWNANTYKLERSMNFGYERAWCVAFRRGSNLIGIGFDAGHVVLQLGREEPAISMDPTGKIVYARNSEVFASVIKPAESSEESSEAADGEPLSLPQKELGSVEIFPTTLQHSPNGRFVAVTGDGEYVIYTALAWRNKSYGPALDFVWAQDSNEYAVRQNASTIRVYKNFKEKNGPVGFAYAAEKIYGGTLLGVRGDGFVAFFDWETGLLVRRVDVEATDVFWAPSGELVLIATDEEAYVLRFDQEAFAEAAKRGTVDPEEGVEEAFEVLYSVADTVRTGEWVGDCFIYTTATNRLSYLVGGQSFNLAHGDSTMYLLGYLPRDNKVYVADKSGSVSAYHLSLAVLEYQTVMLRGDTEAAAELLQEIPRSEKTRVARFLEAQDYKELALEVTADAEHKFELALQIGKLNTALEIVEQAEAGKGISSLEYKWKLLGDAALAAWDMQLAERCLEKAQDLESLLLVFSAMQNTEGLQRIAGKAAEAGKYNLAFTAKWTAGDVGGCRALLADTGRFPESALFALTYSGDGNVVKESVDAWKKDLDSKSLGKLSERLLDPVAAPENFPKPAKAVPEVLLDLEDSEPAEVAAEAKEEEAAANGDTEKVEEEKEEKEEAGKVEGEEAEDEDEEEEKFDDAKDV